MSANNNVSITIPLCGLFKEDDSFNKIKRYLPPDWLNLQSQIKVVAVEDIDESMDNVQFHNDKIEIVINVIGYAPQDIRCSVTPDTIEVTAQQADSTCTTVDGVVQSNLCMNRRYELPRQINVNQTTCFLSSDGFLGITAPWM